MPKILKPQGPPAASLNRDSMTRMPQPMEIASVRSVYPPCGPFLLFRPRIVEPAHPSRIVQRGAHRAVRLWGQAGRRRAAIDKPLTQLGPLGDNGARSGCRGPRGAGEARQLRACACAVRVSSCEVKALYQLGSAPQTYLKRVKQPATFKSN